MTTPSSPSAQPSSASQPRRVAVLGGGVSGLAAALRLADEGHSPTVYEARPVPGGVIRTIRRNGYQVDVGANSMQGKPPLVADLVERLDLGHEIVEPGPSALNRYIVRNGAPLAAPLKPPRLATTKL
ncbi:MAG: FAD-dependent oxidoreductase, partial [Bacteroidota bacterium]